MVLTLLTEVVAFYVRFISIGLQVLAFSGRSQGSASAWAYVVSMNIFMNFVKRFLVGGGTRGGVEASGGVGALSLLASDLPP